MAEEKKSIREVAIDSKLLYQRLAKMEIGDFVSYHELSEIIGRDVQREGRGFLNTARQICQREHEKTFGVIVGAGLKCLMPTEVIGTTNFAIEHIRRTSRKAVKRLKCVGDIEKLTNEDKIKMNANASILGALSVMTRESYIKKIEARVEATREQLPYAKTLEAFK
jgi:hypothetical protein